MADNRRSNRKSVKRGDAGDGDGEDGNDFALKGILTGLTIPASPPTRDGDEDDDTAEGHQGVPSPTTANYVVPSLNPSAIKSTIGSRTRSRSRANIASENENLSTVDPLGVPVSQDDANVEGFEFVVGGDGQPIRFSPEECSGGDGGHGQTVAEVEMMIKDGVLYPVPPKCPKSKSKQKKSTPGGGEGVDGSGSGENEDDDDDDEDSEWEESYVYLDLEDIPSLEELFAVNPDDFLFAWKNKRGRGETPKPKKPTHPSVLFRFHNFDSDKPVLQIGHRFYEGSVEEPFGTCLFLQEKQSASASTSSETPKPGTSQKAKASENSNSSTPQPTKLKKLTSDLNPPLDPIFGAKPQKEYELVAKAHKVIRLTRRHLQKTHSPTKAGLPQTPSGLPVVSTFLKLDGDLDISSASGSGSDLSSLLQDTMQGLEDDDVPPAHSSCSDDDDEDSEDKNQFVFKRPRTPPPLEESSHKEAQA